MDVTGDIATLYFFILNPRRRWAYQYKALPAFDRLVTYIGELERKSQ